MQGGEVCADLTGRLPVACNGSEYLLVALRRETCLGVFKALVNKRSKTIKDAMIDMQLLLRGVWRFRSDEGREFIGAVDDWLREHAVLHTTTGAYDPNANSLVEDSVGARKHGIRCLLLERRAFSGQAECDLLPRERETKFVVTLGLSGVCEKLEHPTVRRRSLDPIALQGIFVGWNRRVPHGIKIATFRDDGEVEELATQCSLCSAMLARGN